MLLPLQFLKFWFWDSPKNLIIFFTSLNFAFLQLCSLPLLIKTYFRPWKNEYREGLVGFSIGMGIFIKTIFIVGDIALFLLLLLFEGLFIIAFISWPVATFFLHRNSALLCLSILYILVLFFVFRPKKKWIDTISTKSTQQTIKELLVRKDILFILKKAEIIKSEIQLIDISKDEIFKNSGGNNPLDFFKAYLLLTEEKTKLLFTKKLKLEDLVNIVAWAKSIYPQTRKPFRVKFWGEGIGESWVSGWTVETNKYMLDITSEAVNKRPMITGREIEHKRIIEALSQNKSCLLVGEPGSGRGSFVQGLAHESFFGKLTGNLHHKRFFELMTDALLAGTKDQGELEKRLRDVITEISHAGNVIIYIPNFENILGASTFNVDLSGELIPYLTKGTIRITANITEDSYKKFIEPRHTLNNVFELIKFEEPSSEITLQMLLQKSLEIERINKVVISYKAIAKVINLANKYLQNRVMPGAGVRLLEDVVGAVIMKKRKNVEEQDVIDKVEEKTKIAVGQPKEQEKELLLNLETELHKKIIGQQEAILEVSEALRRLRAGLGNSKKPISFLFLGPTGVGKTATAKALSSIYYGGENKMIRFDMSEYSTEDSVKRFLGGIADSKGLTDMVSAQPYSLVLLDEFEKSNSKILDLFLQVLDDGRLTDNAGKTISFADAIIIATSNAASEYIREEVGKGKLVDKIFQKDLLEYLQQKGIFRPEFLNRFGGIIVFKPLNKDEISQIAKLMLDELSRKLLEKDIVVSFDEKITEKIVNEGYDEQFGARPLSRLIQSSIEDLLAQKILKEELKRGAKIIVSVNSSNEIYVIINS